MLAFADASPLFTLNLGAPAKSRYFRLRHARLHPPECLPLPLKIQINAQRWREWSVVRFTPWAELYKLYKVAYGPTVDRGGDTLRGKRALQRKLDVAALCLFLTCQSRVNLNCGGSTVISFVEVVHIMYTHAPWHLDICKCMIARYPENLFN